ncbi:hypothetical protein MASR1M90_22950 [Desulfovibrionales bacterium]
MEILYADKKGNVAYQCPECHFRRHFDASQYRDANSRITIKCRCGKIHDVLIDFRSFYRKPVQLYGICTVPRLEVRCPVLIDDLSLHGMRFIFMPENGALAPEVDVHELVSMELRLDNASLDWIKCRLEICTIHNGTYGAKIVSVGHEKELGFYLMH